MKTCIRVLIIMSLSIGCWYVDDASGQQFRPRSFRWCNLDWQVHTGANALPGPNEGGENVWVDAQGLHLKIAKEKDGRWTCAEVSTKQSLGFGRYQFFVTVKSHPRVDKLDPRVVLGLFNYPPRQLGPDGTNEIDIEMSRWGNGNAPYLNFTVYPVRLGYPPQKRSFNQPVSGASTTNRFIWKSDQVFFQVLNGHRDDNASMVASWPCMPTTPLLYIPQKPLPVVMNLWIFGGPRAYKTNATEVEIIIKSFTYSK